MRRKTTLAVCCIFFVAFSSLAQSRQENIDSVKQVLTEQTTYEGKFEQYLALASFYSYNDSTNTAKYVNECTRLSEKTGNEKWKVKALRYIGIVNIKLGHYQQGIDFFDELAENAKSINFYEAEGNAYNNAGAAYLNKGDAKGALDYQLKALKIHQSIQNKKGESLTYFNLGRIYQSLGNNEETIASLKKSLEIRKEIGDPKLIANTELSIGNYHYFQGEFEKALERYFEVEQIYEAIDNERGLLNIYNNVGVVYDNIGNYPRSLFYFLKYLELTEKFKFDKYIPGILLNLGSLFKKQEDYADAMEYYNKSLEKAELLEDQPQIAIAYSNMGNLNTLLGNDNLALIQYEKSIKIDEAIGNKTEIANAYNGVSEIYLRRGNMQMAINYVNKALETSKKLNDQRGMSLHQALLGEIFLKQGKIGQAKSAVSKGLAIAKKIGYPIVIQDAAELLAIIESRLGNHRSAYEAQVLFKQTSDSLKNVTDAKKITLLKANYDFDQEKKQIAFNNEKEILAKNNEIALLTAKEELTRLQLLFGGVAAALVLLVGFLLARGRIRAKSDQAKKLREIGEFKEAMTGMIAHDLKNPLGVMLSGSDQSTTNRHMAGQMLNLVNNMLDIHKFESASVQLKQENHELVVIIDEAIDQVRILLSEKNIKTHTQTDHDKIAVFVDRDYILRVMINFLTNAIKYSELNSVIDIRLSVKGNEVSVSVQDYGRGIPDEFKAVIFEAFGQADPEKSGLIGSTGLGLTFCKLALEAHGSDIQVDSTEGKGTIFTFELQKSSVDATFSSDNTLQVKEVKVSLSEEEKQFALNKLPELQTLKIYQVLDLEEKLFDPEIVAHKPISEWLSQVVNAAYADNQNRFDELIEMIK